MIVKIIPILLSAGAVEQKTETDHDKKESHELIEAIKEQIQLQSDGEIPCEV